MELLKATTDDQEVLVSHRNAALTPVHRLKLARLVVDQGWPVARAAEWFHVSWPTAKPWSERYREVGAAGMEDQPSRPHHSPMRTRQPVVRQIVHLRLKQRLGPVDIAHRLGIPQRYRLLAVVPKGLARVLFGLDSTEWYTGSWYR